MSIGKIAEFKVLSDDWKLYVERLEQYFLVNKIAVELQVPTLITVMGADAYELLVNLCTPEKPTTKTFAQISDIMGRHLQPKPSELAERYKFRHRKQKDGESISEYTAVLKKMSKTCEFGSWLEESLRDQLVCGITNEMIRQRLFAESKLGFGRAYQLAVSLEAAEKDAAEVVRHGGSATGSETAAAASVPCQAMSAARPARRSDARGVSGVARETTTRTGWRRGVRAPAAPAPARLGERAQQRCQVCGANHDTATCKFVRYVCRVCNRQGHLQRMCPNVVEHCNVDIEHSREDNGSTSAESDEVIVIDVCKLDVTKCKPVYIELKVNGKNLKMECDTGSAISCISQEGYRRLFTDLCLEPCNLMLKYYTGETVKPLGVILPMVEYKDTCKRLELFVVENGKTILLGRQWMAELKIQLPIVNYECNNMTMFKNEVFDLHAFSSKYCEVFADGLGRFTGGRVSVHVREGARPVFMRARPLAYALREPVERALAQLQLDGILSPVERSDWATPIVPVVKKDGNIRICADYKLTLNKVIEVDRYPLPRVEELLFKLKGGEHFSKIDLSQAYAQFELDDTRKYTVINTHKGLFMYNRLVYGLSSSPGIFQRRLEQLFNDIPQVGVFLDDIIITGFTREDHMRNLCQVFDRLKKYGLRVKREKCVFFAKSINYLGHTISKDGIHTCPDKVKAINKIPPPTNVSELRAFIGMVMYYGKFVKNVSTVLAPLYNLLRAGVKFSWSKECQEAFTKVKRLLGSSDVLMHYTPELPIILTRTTYTQSGWPLTCSDDLIQPYFRRRNELYTEGGCLMWGYRMVVPVSLQNIVLKQLHSSHMGIVKTKSLARSYVWWPNIDAAVEDMCKQCETCAAEADAPCRVPIQPWPYHTRPWTRLHVDFLGPYKGLTFFVLIDSTSKWIEVFEMKHTNAANVIKVLRSTFARFGLPEELVSDQGPPFTSAEFKNFLKNNGIQQNFSPAYHPSSNGAAENAVKLCKRAIKKAYRDQLDIDTALQTFLLAYRNTVHGTTRETPAMLLQRRTLRSRLDLLRADRVVEHRVREAQTRQVEYAGGTPRKFTEGDLIWARGYGSGDKWVKGTVQGVDSLRRYSVVADSGQLCKRHINQMRRRSCFSDVTGPEGYDESQQGEENVVEPLSEGSEGLSLTETEAKNNNDQSEQAEQSSPKVLMPSESPVNRYPRRNRKPVQRYDI
ncbi:uncharacterized protein K02A2.6 isoform X1 [Helicoverpa armigera]|uniref:uncharacterized protein K02A2.6 isoform X1 n=1 Tax=Helicoverpa armigera TaxID=29058 RepID=UPI00308293A5